MLAAVDEDGGGRPASGCNSSTHCNNIVPFWAMKGMGLEEQVPADGLIPAYTKIHYTDPPRTLSTHSDRVPIGAALGEWRLSVNDDLLGGGIHLRLEGPIKEPDTIFADAMYPARIAVGDVQHVAPGMHATAQPTTPLRLATVFEFTLRVCKSLKPYFLDRTGVHLYADQVGDTRAVFATLNLSYTLSPEPLNPEP